MPDIEGVPYETSGGKVDRATAEALAARHREATSAGVTAAGEAVAPVRSQVSALSSRVDSQDAKTLRDAKAYTDSKVTGLATTAAMQDGDQKSLSDAKAYTDEQVAGVDPLPAGGTAGQVLTRTGTGSAWQNSPTGLPSGGSTGQVLTRTSTGSAWAEPAKGEKGDPGEDGADWSKDQQAKAQGYWIVVSPTEPESGTYTTADGTVVPVIWQKPIEKMVPVIPEAPYFDKYALSIQVASLVGVDYYLTGFTKDGETGDVPDVKIPDGGILKLSDVSGKPALPYTVNVEARAEAGYKLPNAFTWAYSVTDPNEAVLVTSETFSGRSAGSSVIGTATDAALGGAPMIWAGSGTSGTVSETGGYVFGPGTATLKLDDVGVNQRLEFDLTMPDTYRTTGGMGQYFWIQLGNASILWDTPYQGRSPVRGGPLDLRAPGYVTVVSDYPSRLSGHYTLEFYQRSLIVSVPGVAPATIPLPSEPDPTKKSVTIRGEWILDGYVSLDNIKVSRIGF